MKPAKSWTDIIASQEYINAKKSGKIFHHISYKNDEIPENDAKYFLLEFKEFQKAETSAQENDINTLSFSFASIYVQKTGKQMANNHFSFTPNKTIENLNFYCFSDSNINDPVELNFNSLKKCKKTDYIELLKKEKKRFLVVDFDNIVEDKPTNIAKNIRYWHNQDMELLAQFVSGSSNVTFIATIKSILHKGFSLPTTNSNS